MDSPEGQGPARTPAERRSACRYSLEFVAAVASFIALGVFADRAGPSLSGPARVATVLAPTGAALAMALVVARFTLRMDEYQRATVITAGAIAGVATAIVALGLGLLADAGIITVSMTIVPAILALLFALALALVRRERRG